MVFLLDGMAHRAIATYPTHALSSLRAVSSLRYRLQAVACFSPCTGTFRSWTAHVIRARGAMDPQDNKQLALHKAISSHEQAAAGLRDLRGDHSGGPYTAMLERIDRNIADLHAELARSKPEDPVHPE